MFTYLHCYLPETWEAQVRAGLVNDHAGIRFVESIDLEESKKFNVLAAKGGALYDLLRSTRMPFYIDRLQGGCYLENYPYDRALVDDYRSMLGDNFWGFQMHEWMSNLRNDLRKPHEGGITAWNEEGIIKAVNARYPMPHLFLESLSARELADYGEPQNAAAFTEMADDLFRRRQESVQGDLFTCNSYFLAHPIERKYGTRRTMPEIGAQTPNTRVQLAFARGMARASGTPYGAYYETWGGEPFSTCCYQRDGINEWNETNESFPFQAAGANGGSSRSMQRRMHLYAYMAGASFMAEEWAMCNTFYDWQDFELSPYGLVKKDFIRFTEKYPSVGEPLTPIAVVLPKKMPALEVTLSTDERYFDYPATESEKTMLKKVVPALRKLFMTSGPMIGSETTSLLNCTLPDALDIVSESSFDDAALSRYAYVVDLTVSGELSRRYPRKAVSADDVPTLLDTLLPCRVEGDVMKQITASRDGTRYLMLLNNSGITRSVTQGEHTLKEADTTVIVTLQDASSLETLEGDGSLSRREDGSYAAFIPAGGYLFMKL